MARAISDTLEQKMLQALAKAPDKRKTRANLWSRLGLKDGPTDAYWTAEQTLVDQAKIERRRGRNGGIYLLPDRARERGADATAVGEATASVTKEIAHYEPALKQILDRWTEQPGFKKVFGAVTGQQGRRSTGGRWSRPDIIICTVSEWLFSSRPEGEVRTVEVKRYESLDVMAVYEAVSHKARSHYAYLLIVDFPDNLSEDQQKEFDNVLGVAGKNGIGVITAKDSSDWATWEFQLYPTRSDADNQEINQLLLDQVPPDVRDNFTNAIRQIQLSVSF